MKTLQVRLPDSVHGQMKKLAKREGVSLNQVMVYAASNEAMRQETREFFAEAAQGYDAAAFTQALDAVPDVLPVEGDER